MEYDYFLFNNKKKKGNVKNKLKLISVPFVRLHSSNKQRNKET
jgi:hypothetical protein